MIKVDPTSYFPLYEQVKEEIRKLVMTGALKAGEPLPSIRDLASHLVVNPNTVARAYRELEQDGLIVTKKGKGCYVSATNSPVSQKVLEAHLHKIFDQAIAEAMGLNMKPLEIQTIFDRRLMRHVKKDKKGGGLE